MKKIMSIYDDINFDLSREESYLPESLSLEFTEEQFKELDKMFNSYIGREIQKILEIQDKFQAIGQYTIAKSVLEEFIDKLYTFNCPAILKLNVLEQQCFLLYLVANLFYRYNENVLKMEHDEFISRVYYVNILSLCSKFFSQARRMYYRILKNIYIEVEEKSKDIIEFYAQLYRADDTIIKNDIIYFFMISILPKFNTLTVENVEEFYTSIFRRIFYFYLKSKVSGLTTHEVDPSIIQDGSMAAPSERYRIYEEALYLAQIQNMCSDSSTIHRISKHFDEMKGLIVPNEIQRLYLYAINNGKYNAVNQKFTILKMHTELDRMDYIKNSLPIIYRLLRSMRIATEQTSFLESDIVQVQETIYQTLYNKFSEIISDEDIIPIIKNITNNLVKSLTTGGFIDMITLTPVNLSGQKFIQQLKIFLELILSGMDDNKNLLRS